MAYHRNWKGATIFLKLGQKLSNLPMLMKKHIVFVVFFTTIQIRKSKSPVSRLRWWSKWRLCSTIYEFWNTAEANSTILPSIRRSCHWLPVFNCSIRLHWLKRCYHPSVCRLESKVEIRNRLQCEIPTAIESKNFQWQVLRDKFEIYFCCWESIFLNTLPKELTTIWMKVEKLSNFCNYS